MSFKNCENPTCKLGVPNGPEYDFCTNDCRVKHLKTKIDNILVAPSPKTVYITVQAPQPPPQIRIVAVPFPQQLFPCYPTPQPVILRHPIPSRINLSWECSRCGRATCTSFYSGICGW